MPPPTKAAVRGGKKLGSGAHGSFYSDVKNDIQAFLPTDPHAELTIYYLAPGAGKASRMHVLHKRVHARDFLAHLGSRGGPKLGFKHLRAPYLVQRLFHAGETDFKNEMQSIVNLSYMGLAFMRRETAQPLLTYRGTENVVGMRIDGGPEENVAWLVLQRVCGGAVSSQRMTAADVGRMILDILPTVGHLQRHGYLHTDIHQDNVVEGCALTPSRRYTLIDWGEMKKISAGQELHHPTASFLSGMPLTLLADHPYVYRLLMAHLDTLFTVRQLREPDGAVTVKERAHAAWLDGLTARLAGRYRAIIDQNKGSVDALVKRFRHRYDLYGLGTAAVQLMRRNGLADPKLRAAVECLWDPDSPCTDAAAALKRCKQLFA